MNSLTMLSNSITVSDAAYTLNSRTLQQAYCHARLNEIFAKENDSLSSKILAMHDDILTNREIK
jgi:hypothetical protein